MKRLLLLLTIAANATCMEQNHQNYADNSLQEISQEATQLHEFLTENLDNTDETLSDAAVSRVAGKLKELNVNPAILLELKDKRSKQVYDFEPYLKKNKNKQLVIIAKNPRCLPLSSRTAANGSYTLLADSLQIATINVCQSSNNNDDLLQNKAIMESFDLVNNGEQRNGNASYSLMHLLLRCKRPGALVTILNESPYMPFLPDTGLLKSYCENSSTDWRNVTQIIDDGCELASAVNGVVKTGKLVSCHLPKAAAAYYFRYKIKDDIAGIAAAITNPKMIDYPPKEAKALFSGIGIIGFKAYNNNWPLWLRNLTSASSEVQGANFNSDEGQGFFLINPGVYALAYVANDYVQPFWTQLVDKVNDRLQIDQKISNLLGSVDFSS